MLMKHTKTNDYKRIFIIYFACIAFLVILGLIMSIRGTGKFSHEASVTIRSSSVVNSTFSNAMTKSLTGHLLYCFFVIFGNFPGLVACGIYAGFKAFSIGTVIGLAVKYCAFKKAFTICFCTFISNVFIFPLYATLFVMNFKYSTTTHANSLYSQGIFKGYFSYLTRIFVVFTLLCAVDCMQNALGLFAVNLPG